MIEIGVIICAICILLASGARMLLTVIVVPTVLFLGIVAFVVTKHEIGMAKSELIAKNCAGPPAPTSVDRIRLNDEVWFSPPVCVQR